MNSYFANLGFTALAVFIYMTGGYFLAMAKKRNDLADQAWGLGFVLIAILTALMNRTEGSFLILLLMVLIWGGRLFWHIYRRHRKTAEDQRYQELVDKKKSRFVESFLKVFMLQGLFMLVVALPIISFGYYNGPISGLKLINWLGILIWVIGFVFESVADRQLELFIKKPENKGQLMTSGLWAFSRHPNYFGEITMWWGIFILTLQNQFVWVWFASILGPILITYLIVFVSGIPLLEKKYLERADFKKYALSTSVLIPWFKKKTN
jgi:steroid 5-alpha reductase family enzyme